MERRLSQFAKTSVIVVILLSTPALTIIIPQVSEREIASDLLALSQDASNSVNISSDADFVEQGWEGSGTPADPYLIQNLIISGYGEGIRIRNVSDSFVVRNCTISSPYIGDIGFGINITDVLDGVIENCTVKNKREGIHILFSPSFTIQGCKVSEIWSNGISLIDGFDSVIQNLEISDCGGNAIYVSNSPDTRILNNEISGESGGLYIIDSNYLEIRENVIQNCDYAIMYGSDSLAIRDNVFYNCSISPSDLEFNSGPQFLENTSANGKAVVWLEGQANLELNGEDFGQIILVRCENVTIRGGEFSKASSAIYLFDCTDCLISNVTFKDYSVYLDSIFLLYCQSCKIEDSIIRGGMALLGAQGSVVVRNTIENAFYGVRLQRSDNSIISENRFINPTGVGIECSYSDECFFVSNIFSNNYIGIRNIGSEDSSIIGCTFRDSYDLGLYIDRVNNLTIRNSAFFNDGLFIEELDEPNPFKEFENVSCNGKPILVVNGEEGYDIDASSYGEIVLLNSKEISVSGGSFLDTDIGVILHNCSSCSVVDSEFNNVYYGIYDYETTNITIIDCTFSDASVQSIFSVHSRDIKIHRDTFSFSQVSLLSVYSFELANNTFSNCGPKIDFYTSSCIINTVSGNSINGKSLGYFANETGIIIDGNSYGQIILQACENSTIENGSFSGVANGVSLEYCVNCSIRDVEASSNDETGIYLMSSQNCSIIDCSTSLNKQNGITLSSSFNCSIINCTSKFNGFNGIGTPYSDVCHIERNSLSYNGAIGLSIDSSEYSTIVNNTMTFNHLFGIYTYRAKLNTIIQNRIGGNDHGPVTRWYDTYYTNAWDDGEALGNFWELYDGNGVFHIPFSSDIDHYPQRLIVEYPETTPTQTITEMELPDEIPILSLFVTAVCGTIIVIGGIGILRRRKGAQ